MQKECGIVLRNRCKTLPYADLMAGLAQTLTTQDSAEGLTFVTEKKPVSYDVVEIVNGTLRKINCQGKEMSLLPNSNRKSIIYFEDNGISPLDRKRGLQGYSVGLRMVCWMNKLNLVGDAYVNIAGQCMAAAIHNITTPPAKYKVIDGLPMSEFKAELEGIARQNVDIFSKYTLKETDRQYLRPPYEFFAIDFRCSFYVDPKCIQQIPFTGRPC